MKLGCVPSRPDPRDLRMAAYMTTQMTPAPLARKWTTTLERNQAWTGDPAAPEATVERPVRFETFMNLVYGTCTCAALGHIDQAAAAQTRQPARVTDEMVITAYDAISVWDRRNPTTHDVGASCREALKHFMKIGVIEGYARINPTSITEIMTAVNLCGAAYVGADLPLAAQKQDVWSVTPDDRWTSADEPRSWGGHAMAILGYDRSHVLFATWGKVQRATWPWVLRYVDEAYLVFADAWTNPAVLTPSGFDIDRMVRDARLLAA